MSRPRVQLPRDRRRPRTEAGTRIPANSTPLGAIGFRGQRGEPRCADCVADEIVSVEVATAAFTVTDEGLKEQAAPAGRPEQVSATEPVNPPVGVTVTVVLAEDPAARLADAGLMDSANVALDTVTDAAAELLPAYVLSPL